MIRIKSSAFKHKKKILQLSKGFINSNLFKQVNQKYNKSLFNQFIARKLKKRFFRRFWIVTINNYLKKIQLKYSIFISNLKKQQIGINRRMLYLLLLLDKLHFI